MPHIAFYAPMKPPNHPTPSGDRAVAQAVLKALGSQAELVSTLRVYDGKGDAKKQDDLIEKAGIETQALIKKGRDQDWKIWFTYHNYYKAPDLIGPIVSQALGIPYVLLEATRAKKRLNGPWSNFAHLAEKACDQADVILYFTKQDYQALEAYRAQYQQIIHLPPFLTETKTAAPRNKPDDNTILSVGMMRQGAKMHSYALIAQALSTVKTLEWSLNIIGDGPARKEVEEQFAQFGDRIRFPGQLNAPEIAKYYENASVLIWPGVDEAFGMVYLEAQASGLPVVAQDRPGLRDVIAPLTKLSSVNSIDDMAQNIDLLLNDAEYWQIQSHNGIEYIKQNHLLGAARKNLMTILSPLIGSQH